MNAAQLAHAIPGEHTGRYLYTPYVSEFLQEFMADLDTQIGVKNTTPVALAALDFLVAVVRFDRAEVTREN